MTTIAVAWMITYVACAYPPHLDRASCHGLRFSIERYSSKAACEADIPRLLKEKHPGWRVVDPVCVHEDYLTAGGT